uniref:Putative conserved secreted protein n=1 Tax=Ixodes ricinus TaxID=34613 RepID=A0A6B0V4R2_IXORI
MAIKKVALLCLALCSATARIRHGETDKCPPLDPNWEDKLDELFSALPADFPNAIPMGLFLDPDTDLGFMLGNTSFSGLAGLKPDRPYETFCRDSERVIQFSLRATEFLQLSIPWTMCSGLNGTIRTVAPLSRIEGQIHLNKTEGASKWVLESLEMVRLERQYITVDGMGSGAKTVIRWVDALMGGMTRVLWVNMSPIVISYALEDTARKVGISLKSTTKCLHYDS